MSEAVSSPGAPVERVALTKGETRLIRALYREEIERRKWLRVHRLEPGRRLEARPYGAYPEAPREGPWWGVQRLGPHGRFSRRAMFRHLTLEHAQIEARFLAESYPGGVFAVVQMVSLHCEGAPEVKIGS